MNESTEVYAWGDDEDGQLGLGENRTKRFYTLPMICSFNIVLTQVSCGKDHSAILATNGHIYTMGSNQYGKLGTKTSDSAAPQLVESLSRYKCIQISCGDNHTGCVMQGGAAYTWGDNTYGQLGVKRAQEPVQVMENTQQISCGNLHTLILTKTGEVFAFGNGEYGQLGNKISKSFDPLSIRSPLIKQVVACNNFSLLLSSEGTAYACGQNYGINICRQYTKCNYFKYKQDKFVKLDGYVGAAGLTANNELIVFDSDIIMKDIADFAIGNDFGIAVGQECYSWGTNNKGQLGSGNQQQIQQPQIIEQLNGKQIFNLSAGDSYVLALGNANKYYQNHQSSFSQSNIRSVSRKGEERSRSNFSDRSHVDDISKLNKQILDKDKIIQQMKQDHKMQLEGLQAKILQQQEIIQNKNQQIVELESIIEKLKEENTLLLSQPHPLNQPSKVLQCQVVKCLNDFDNLQTISPIKATVNKIKYEFEDSLQKTTTNNQSQQELKSQKYQSQENFKRLFDIENRPQSQIKQRQNLDDTATHKTNLTTIKSRLTDLQKNKSALENRMKQFEERLKEKKSYQA